MTHPTRESTADSGWTAHGVRSPYHGSRKCSIRANSSCFCMSTLRCSFPLPNCTHPLWLLRFFSTRFGFDLIYGGDSEQVAVWTDVGVPALEKAFGGGIDRFPSVSEEFCESCSIVCTPGGCICNTVKWLVSRVILQWSYASPCDFPENGGLWIRVWGIE